MARVKKRAAMAVNEVTKWQPQKSSRAGAIV